MAQKTIKDEIYNFKKIKKGNWLLSWQFRPYNKSDGSNPSNTLSNVRLMFRRGSETGTLTKTLVSGTEITIENSTTWLCTVAAFLVDWAVDDYYYDVETTDSAGKIVTTQGGILPVVQSVTYT